MEWTDIRLTVSKADAEAAEAVATMIAEGGIYIEDYSDIEEQVEQIAHVDLIEQVHGHRCTPAKPTGH